VDVLKAVKAQIDQATSDLVAYRPTVLDWRQRATRTAEDLIPWLILSAPGLRTYVEDVLNAPINLRSRWEQVKKQASLPLTQVAEFERQLRLDDVLRESITGETVSKVVSRFLMDNHPASALCENGRSDYPDLYLSTHDYSGLPAFKRKKTVSADDEYGAAVKGPKRHPVRVPDGLEIKTCRDRVAVDCHHPHAGLHLVLLFRESKRVFSVADILVAFLRKDDYREAGRNTTATTVKYSFGGDRFHSLFPTS
jgi:hypothetical protein